MKLIRTRLPRRWNGADWSIHQCDLSNRSLAWFRIGLAGVLLAQAACLIGAVNDLFGQHGPGSWSLTLFDAPPQIPRVSWFEQALSIAGGSTELGAPLALGVYVASLVGLLVGYRTRQFAIIAWLTHTALMTSGQVSTYGADRFAHIGLFYCAVFPVGQTLAFDVRGSKTADEFSIWSWLGLRVLQVHTCIMYTASGIEKAMGEQWWNGEAVWRAIMGAPFECSIDCSFLAYVPWLAKVAGWTTPLLEAGVVAFMWHRRLRRLWLVCIVGMHLGIAVLIGLWAFSAVMIVYDVSAFWGQGDATKK